MSRAKTSSGKARRESKRQLRAAALDDTSSSGAKFNRREDAVTEIGMLQDTKRDTRPIVHRNPNQAKYINAIRTKKLIFATGEAGTGKTFISSALAAEMLLERHVERIIVTRPVLQADEDLGFLPGDVNEKFGPYFKPVQEVLQRRMGGSFLSYCLRPVIGKVEIAPFAYLRGRSFDNCVIILDEAQNTTVNQMKMFLTRIGENCTVIVNGDVLQCDLPAHKQSGLADALTRFETNSLVEIINFTKADSVRSDICSLALDAYER